MRKTQYLGRARTPASGSPRSERRRAPRRVRGHAADARRESRKRTEQRVRVHPAGKFRRRRTAALGLIALVSVLLAGALLPLSWATGTPPPVSPNGVAPDVTLARAGGLDLSTPISPSKITGIGYHPDGAGLVDLEPRGADLSSGLLPRLISGGSTPGDIRYHTMDPAGRFGPETGALDVGANAGATVRAPVSGTITAIRPDPLMRGANLIELQPASAPNMRVYVSLVGEISSGTGVESPVRAGETSLGTVADSAKVLDSQLSSYAGGSGNHVTIAAARMN